jgi:hypothetical protein
MQHLRPAHLRLAEAEAVAATHDRPQVRLNVPLLLNRLHTERRSGKGTATVELRP